MAPRAYWTGHIRLSLVTFPVRLYPARTSTKKIQLHKYDKESGQRIHYQNVNEEGEVVEPDDIIKGYEYEKGSFIPIEDEELEKLRLESKHTVDIVQFSDMSSIDPIYFDAPYYVAPDGDVAQEAYLTIREALRETKKVAIGQIILHNKERIVALKPCGNGLLMETLRYNYEVRQAEDYFRDIEADVKIDKDQLDLAQELIKRKSAPFEPGNFKDLYQEGLKEIINAKLEDRPVEIEKGGKKPGKVVNIMDALKKSLEETDGEKTKKTASKSAKSKTKSKTSSSKSKKAG